MAGDGGRERGQRDTQRGKEAKPHKPCLERQTEILASTNMHQHLKVEVTPKATKRSYPMVSPGQKERKGTSSFRFIGQGNYARKGNSMGALAAVPLGRPSSFCAGGTWAKGE